jgi:hypothetical protein
MKARLLFEDRDTELQVKYSGRGFDVSGPDLPRFVADVERDLGVETVLRAMAGGDALIYQLARDTLLRSLTDPAEIRYRQEILADLVAHPSIALELYAASLDAVLGEHKIYTHLFGDHPTYILSRAVKVLELFVGLLHRLRKVADDHRELVRSRGLTELFSMLERELDDDYFRAVDAHLQRLKFKGGTLLSAKLGKGTGAVEFVFRSPNDTKRGLRERLGFTPRNSYHFEINPRDEAGAQLLTEMTDRGLNAVANALAQSTDHILSFFSELVAEIGFYVGALKLHERLVERGLPICVPEALSSDHSRLLYDEIFDVGLALQSDGAIVGNSADAGDRPLVVLTGTNSGGKSTLLRALGLAQLMTQGGLFVGAKLYSANTADGIFTHFVREEDATMTSGKLDEELARMSALAEEIRPGSLALFNESFAATNEREGSEIARQIIDALVEQQVKVLFVTHQYTLAKTLFDRGGDTALFLRAERASDGQRTFKLHVGEPLPTSFGEDIYRRIGGFQRRSGQATARPIAAAENA